MHTMHHRTPCTCMQNAEPKQCDGKTVRHVGRCTGGWCLRSGGVGARVLLYGCEVHASFLYVCTNVVEVVLQRGSNVVGKGRT